MATTTTTRTGRTTPAKTAKAAGRTTAKMSQAVPEPRTEAVTTVEEQAQPDAKAENEFGYLVDKAPTALHKNYLAWLQEETGMEMTERDLKILQMVCVTRGAFQKSDANQSDLSARKQAWNKAQADKKARRLEKAKAELEKLSKELGVTAKSA